MLIKSKIFYSYSIIGVFRFYLNDSFYYKEIYYNPLTCIYSYEIS